MFPEEHHLPAPGGLDVVAQEASAIVVGGGIAGVAAATVLAERGMRVVLLEKESYLGGRAGAWTERLGEGSVIQMERGFHAFFRQYYNLRALLRRIDPELSFLKPLDDYPILGLGGETLSFAGLPRSTPANLAALVSRSPAIRLRDLVRVNAARALEMLTFDMTSTYARRDGMPAAEYLDSLRFPETARRLFFDVFAHSFFNPEEEMSAAELLMMFHFYFTGNPEGLVFDVANAPFSTAIWAPYAAYLRSLGVEVRYESTGAAVEARTDGGWEVIADASSVRADAVVLALPVPALRDFVSASSGLEDAEWRSAVEGLAVTRPFAVWRIWLDRPTNSNRAPFVGTTGMGSLDNVSVYHLIEEESRAWAEASGGAVVELHAYAVPTDIDERGLRRELLGALHALYPETAEARTVEEQWLFRRDCPAFALGSHSNRPGVATPFEGLTLAGDFVKLPFPSALMERAAASGILAANRILARWNVRPEPLRSVPTRGILARPFFRGRGDP